MRIERINEMTIKFYLTYTDLEERGFKQDDLWTNRKKGEEFFWSMMEEVNQEEEFVIEGPLWIQVHAFDKGPDGKDYIEGVKSPLNYDKEEAKDLYEKAKEELGKDEFTFEYLTYDADTSKKDAEYVKEQIETNLPGVKLKIKQQPFKQKLALESKKDYELSFAGWGPDYPDPMTFLDMFVTDGPHNQMDYSNDEYDKMIKDAKGPLLQKTEERWKTLQDAETMFLEDAPIIPMYQRGTSRMRQDYVKNLVTHKFAGDTTLKETYIEGK